MLNEADREFVAQSQVDSRKAESKLKAVHQGTNSKLLRSIEEAIDVSGLRKGMMISFHHGLQSGDYVMNAVLKMIAHKGIKGLTLVASSSLHTNDTLLTPFFLEGVIVAAQTSGLRHKLEHFFSTNKMEKQIIVGAHDGRVPAMGSGEVKIDVAFIAASSCDIYGNMNGLQEAESCASMNTVTAGTVVAITDNLVDHPICPIRISQRQADYIVKIDYR